MEVLIPFAKDKNGSLAFVDEVESGLECNCFCISCDMPLSAHKYKTNIRRDHFKHAPKVNSKDKPCEISYKRAIFWLCRNILATNSSIRLPRYIGYPSRDKSDEGVLVTDEKVYEYQSKVTLNPAIESAQNEIAILHTNDFDITLILTLEISTYQFSPTYNQKSAIVVVDVEDFRKYVEGKVNGYRDQVESELLEKLGIKYWHYHPKQEQRFTEFYRSRSQKILFAKKEQAQRQREEQNQLAEESELLYNPVYGFQHNPQYKSKPTRAFREIIDLNPAPKQYETRWFRCGYCTNMWQRSSTDVPYSVTETPCPSCNHLIRIG
ncbi:hypothetical protein [Pseudoalteromonas luteoviolacea]|uniref:Competence protein CoiA n=1 Tax=Pseudoalteromonas luteoviolacea DSM 6061 TaxID=1365250 RepID=A0A166VHY4_9GAMM|nr:hypothetical protein [Pseudoalteromonas luteoviolacea]KZN32895.1 hypothetical protein N475_20460 [Pseudoalteromonas luteoviolacea DSM 6061]MBE0385389.1 hypothetical protein [Pseudoalteromonas luteoviolacea DSM 6061]